jgi:serine/threonine protein kinase
VPRACYDRTDAPAAPRRRVDGPDASPGVLIGGRYRLLERVGRGATATVWRARDEMLDREVAVKQLGQRHAHPLDEARLAARVRHPGVAAVLDVVQHGDSYCLVMEFHPGSTLAELLRDRRRLAPSTVAALGLQLLDALRAVHAAGVVHCDVKPANLLLDDDGRLTLVDFGIAETGDVGPGPRARRNGEVIGSPAFMAPELVRGDAPRPAADLWSLGATLYDAVEGHPPFPQDDVEPTLSAVLHDPPEPAGRAGRLRPLLSRLLVKDPAARPSHDTVHAMLREAFPAVPDTGLVTPFAGAGLQVVGGTPRGARAEQTVRSSVGRLPEDLPSAV